jgi:hypothetical protein
VDAGHRDSRLSGMADFRKGPHGPTSSKTKGS